MSSCGPFGLVREEILRQTKRMMEASFVRAHAVVPIESIDQLRSCNRPVAVLCVSHDCENCKRVDRNDLANKLFKHQVRDMYEWDCTNRGRNAALAAGVTHVPVVVVLRPGEDPRVIDLSNL